MTAVQPPAFDQAYHELQPLILAYVRRRMRNATLNGTTPEDAAQITWCKCWAAYEPPLPGEPLEPYRRMLYVIARNVVADLIKAYKRQQYTGITLTMPEQHNHQPDQDPATNPVDTAEARELATRARSALAALPRYQAEIMQAHIHGHSPQEIAEARATTPGAVRHAVMRARRAMLEHMEAHTPCKP